MEVLEGDVVSCYDELPNPFEPTSRDLYTTEALRAPPVQPRKIREGLGPRVVPVGELIEPGLPLDDQPELDPRSDDYVAPPSECVAVPQSTISEVLTLHAVLADEAITPEFPSDGSQSSAPPSRRATILSERAAASECAIRELLTVHAVLADEAITPEFLSDDPQSSTPPGGRATTLSERAAASESAIREILAMHSVLADEALALPARGPQKPNRRPSGRATTLSERASASESAIREILAMHAMFADEAIAPELPLNDPEGSSQSRNAAARSPRRVRKRKSPGKG